MNVRMQALLGAVALTGLGLIWTVMDLMRPAPARPTILRAVARTQIAPYTFVTQDMIAAGDTVPARDAREQGTWALEEAVGKMSTNLIMPGEPLTVANALPAETVRYVNDMGLEIVSFQAGVDRMVGGRLRSGSLINLYGFGQDEGNQPFTTLVEPRLWVVGVSAGGQPVVDDLSEPDPRTGDLSAPARRDRPATLITVAVPPNVAFHVIDSLGARSLSAWVTLAANTVVSLPTPGRLVQAPAGTPTAWPGLPDPRITATPGPTPGGDLGWGWGADR